ncbi:MmgE/PrpD family protein [Caulobacter sp. FWC2]|uniref:MmgE/PrpD family protein n=1 Tax=Caulobacter sp. FWC2 TaxID=69664 RepID=UPI000C156A64|nr:MmgE/PrpD family protein [Caulobacter sp. FWC2]PIB91827.1 MmgE/PrpD family protein [Caulobacter sp. FWC2]
MARALAGRVRRSGRDDGLARSGGLPPLSGLTAAIIRQSRAAAADIPPATLDMAGLCVLDWFGLAIGGADEPATRLIREVALMEGSAPAASAVGAGKRFSARQAAVVNGVAGHALDYDDVNLAMHVHPTAVILPGLLALAEAERLAGRAVIEAFVAGYEAAGMIGTLISTSHYARGFHATGTIGAFGAAAACAHLLGLDEEATARAYGLAGSQAAGLKAQFGTMAKPLHAGRAAEAGVMAALWARAGLSARADILEHPRGFAATQSDGLPAEGLRWDGHAMDKNLFKHHAACFGTHGTLEAIGALRRQGLAPEAVRAIRLKVDAGADAMCNIAEPRTGLEAKFSLRFNAALALHGIDTSDVGAYADAVVQRADLQTVRAITEVELAPAGWPEDVTEVTVETRDGRMLVACHDVSKPAGDLNVLKGKLRTKFLNLVEPRLGVSRAKALMNLVETLVSTESLDGLLAASCGGA